jgi:hypothetical protein
VFVLSLNSKEIRARARARSSPNANLPLSFQSDKRAE